MSDLSDLLYSDSEVELLNKLLGQKVLHVESDDNLFTNIVCQSGFTLFATPEEVWVSSKDFDDVGYSWVKRAMLSDKPWGRSPSILSRIFAAISGKSWAPPPSTLGNVSGVVSEIFVIRSAILFNELLPDKDAPHQTGMQKVDALLDELAQKYASRDFDWLILNPDLLTQFHQQPRHAVVDIGFILKIGESLISVATYDNFFSLSPAVFQKSELNDTFSQRHKCLTIHSSGTPNGAP